MSKISKKPAQKKSRVRKQSSEAEAEEMRTLASIHPGFFELRNLKKKDWAGLRKKSLQELVLEIRDTGCERLLSQFPDAPASHDEVVHQFEEGSLRFGQARSDIMDRVEEGFDKSEKIIVLCGYQRAAEWLQKLLEHIEISSTIIKDPPINWMHSPNEMRCAKIAQNRSRKVNVLLCPFALNVEGLGMHQFGLIISILPQFVTGTRTFTPLSVYPAVEEDEGSSRAAVGDDAQRQQV